MQTKSTKQSQVRTCFQEKRCLRRLLPRTRPLWRCKENAANGPWWTYPIHWKWREEAQVRKAQNQRRTKIRRLIRPLLIFRLELCLKRASNHNSSSPPQREAIWLCVKQALLKPLQLVLLTQRKIRLLQVISNRRKPRLQALMRKKPGRIRLTNAVLQLAQLTMKQTYKWGSFRKN